MSKTQSILFNYLTGAVLLGFLASPSYAQINEDQLGIWTAYSWNARFANSRWGLRGDVQLRNWDIYRDTEQYLARAGFTYSSKINGLSYQLGIASVTSSEFGPGNSSNTENRIFQDLSYRHGSGKRIDFSHRFRAEQRWIENQKFRTRYRYSLAVTVPLNDNGLNPRTWFVALNNELFLNGETDIGNNRRVDYFDRNRSAVAVGYVLGSGRQIQFGYMHQWTDDIDKGQLQLRLSQRF